MEETKIKLINKKKIIVTSALPYVNNVPHLGNLVCVISADVFTRYLELKNLNFISILGTDEHGTTAEIKAKEEGLTPKQLTDKYFKIHKKIYNWFNCGEFCFGRTSSKENFEISQHIFKQLDKNGFIVENELEQTYCEKCELFLADRFVEGICPFCGYEGARGDQCDECGKLLDSKQLIEPKCKICGSKPIIKKTKHLFIDLPKIQPELEKWVEKEKQGWSQNALSTTNSWLKEGLKQRCITRDLKWGIPVPKQGYENKVFYSWFDAPIGYISISKECNNKWKEFWKDKQDTALVQFMGKDNIPFHTILFPSVLIGTKEPWTLMTNISVNEYLNYEGKKFSKSKNIGIYGDDVMSLPFCSDVWRYYISINRPEKTDTDFNWDDFKDKYNSELIGSFGNLVNRTLTFIKNYLGGETGEISKELAYEQHIQEYENLIDSIELKKALKKVNQLTHLGNEYFQKNEPWKLIKGNGKEKKRASCILTNLFNLIKDISILAYPFMPETSKNIWKQLGFNKLNWEDLNKKIENHTIGEPQILFKKIEDKKFEEMKKKFSGKREEINKKEKQKTKDFKKQQNNNTNNNIKQIVDLKVGKIIEIEDHPNADKLYKIQVDLGTEKRQLCAGLKPFLSKQELLNKKVIIVTNLKSAKLRGELSQGMLLAADKEINGRGVVKILSLEKSEVGNSVYFENIKKKPAKEITIDEFFKIKLSTNSKGFVFGDNCKLKTDKEEIKSELVNAKIR